VSKRMAPYPPVTEKHREEAFWIAMSIVTVARYKPYADGPLLANEASQSTGLPALVAARDDRERYKRAIFSEPMARRCERDDFDVCVSTY